MSENVKYYRGAAQRQGHMYHDMRLMMSSMQASDSEDNEVNVGKKLREIRIASGLSIRSLAKMSGLNTNTLSLIENGKTSPSVSTLQQLAEALRVQITAFFETERPEKREVFQKNGKRIQAKFSHGKLENLGTGLSVFGGQPFLVTLNPKADSGPLPIVHTGHEFVFCLEGSLLYCIEDRTYLLEPGDSLIFEAHQPHRWSNPGDIETRSLLILCPTDGRDHPVEQHFLPE
ncbi:MAG: cupin domain-containing protein [Anaerolineales bacterium]|nr:cupin domain-containing protein [Anaerolineales bacterium]